MRVAIRYFAALREAVGHPTDALELAPGATVATARAALAERYPAVAALLPRCVAAVNRAYVTADAPLTEGDELVFVPPLGGGSPCPR
ncbi:MAG TPA: MoaD/ThiS family protein [Ktedonobacterales bacterium]|jgi:molybdopterin converting factor subunit 1